MGMSQEKLADSVGVTFQQVQKYERGTNRISASRLYRFSKILDVSIDFFYQGVDKILSQPEANYGMSDNPQSPFSTEKEENHLPEDILNNKESLDVLKAFYSIKNEKKRKELLTLVKSMAKNLA